MSTFNILTYNHIIVNNRKKYDTKSNKLKDVPDYKPKTKFRLFGFRSGKFFHKVISCAYLIYPIMMFYALIFMPMGNKLVIDNILDKASVFITILLFIAPHICLSETSYRDSLPFFKRRTFLSSVVGLAVVEAILLFLLAALQGATS